MSRRSWLLTMLAIGASVTPVRLRLPRAAIAVHPCAASIPLAASRPAAREGSVRRSATSTSRHPRAGARARRGSRGPRRSPRPPACRGRRRTDSRGAARRRRASHRAGRCRRRQAAARPRQSHRRAAGRGSVQGVALPDRDEPIEVADRCRAREDLDASVTGGREQRPSVPLSTFHSSRPPGFGPSSTSSHVGAALRRGGRCGEPSGATTDDEHIGVPAAILGPPCPIGLLLRQASQARRVAENLLVGRPQPTWADECLVVEAGRRERAADGVGDRHHVKVEARPGVHVLDRGSLAHRLGARADAGSAVDGDKAVGTLTGE